MGRLRVLGSIAAAAAGVALLALALGRSDASMRAAARRLRGLAGPRDLVVVAEKTDPAVVDQFAPLAAVVTPDPPLESLAPFRRVFVVRADPTVRTVLGARFGPGRRHGAEIDSYSPESPSFDARAELSRATVRRGEETCPTEGSRHRCSGARWRTVERRRMTVGGHELDCLFAHPSADGLVITYPSWPGSGFSGVVRGAGGLSDRAARRPGGPPVELRIEVDGRLVGHRKFPNRQGLVGFSFPFERPGALTVRLGVSSQGARSFCLMMWGQSSGLQTTASSPHTTR